MSTGIESYGIIKKEVFNAVNNYDETYNTNNYQSNSYERNSYEENNAYVYTR